MYACFHEILISPYLSVMTWEYDISKESSRPTFKRHKQENLE